MLSTRPHLTTLRPSPSTTSYTVSTASPRHTLASHLLHQLLLLLRILLGLSTSLLLYTKLLPPSPPALLAPLSAYLSSYPWTRIAPLAFTILFLVFRRYHTGEQLIPSILFSQRKTPRKLTSKITNRRKPPDPPHPRHPNQHPLVLVPPPRLHPLHPHLSDPRHLHP